MQNKEKLCKIAKNGRKVQKMRFYYEGCPFFFSHPVVRGFLNFNELFKYDSISFILIPAHFYQKSFLQLFQLWLDRNLTE